MFSVELKINGVLTGSIYGRNLYQLNVEDDFLYEYEYYEVGKGIVLKGEIVYKRKQGLNKLINIILTDVEKQQKEQNNGLELKKNETKGEK